MVIEDRPTMPYSTPPGEEDLEYVSEELPDPKSLDSKKVTRLKIWMKDYGEWTNLGGGF